MNGKRYYSYLRYLFIIAIAFLIFSRYFDLPISMVILFGSSMAPAINIGDVAILAKGEFNEGDVVLWCSNVFNCILHRVISISGDSVITKGDANKIPDPPIPREMVKYRAILIVPSYVWIPLLIIIIYLLYYRDRG